MTAWESWVNFKQSDRGRLAAGVFVMALVFGYGAYTSGPNVPRSMWILASCGGAVSLLIGYAVLRKHTKRKELVLRTDFRVCARCEHDLSGLDDQGRCPECGEKYDREGLRRFWSQKLTLDLTKPPDSRHNS